MIRVLAAVPLALALAACGENTEQPADDTRSAEGEVLGGTIDDAMLPLDTVQSQSPPLRQSPSPSPGADEPAEAGDPGAEGEEPDAEPIAEATPEDEG